jgi:hypothetical protein
MTWVWEEGVMVPLPLIWEKKNSLSSKLNLKKIKLQTNWKLGLKVTSLLVCGCLGKASTWNKKWTTLICHLTKKYFFSQTLRD